jgi:L-ribulokinase
MAINTYVIGVDYGTDSVRSVLVNAADGEIIATSVFYYPRWKKGLYCDPLENQFRQHPLDYVEGLEQTIKDCISQVDVSIRNQIKAISIDTTGSTPVAVNKAGIPLALTPEFAENPNAMFVLWKDHTAVQEAAELNAHAQKFDINYLKYVGGIYSSEWFWAKMLRILRVDTEVRNAAYTWIEHCDWIPFLLTGGKDASEIKRGVCSAGHKALWSEEFGGFPPQEFFSAWDSLLDDATSHLTKETYTASESAGNITEEWAQKLGLSTDVKIGIGAFDAHMGAVGGQIEPYHLSKVMGTSTCDMLVAPSVEVNDKLIKGICGQVNGSIIPGMTGLEAGQSAFGDAYAWFQKMISWPVEQLLADTSLLTEDQKEKLREEHSNNIIVKLSKAASEIPLNLHNELAIDWLNGRRTPDANQELKGAFFGLDLGTNAPAMFKALIEATCFGAKKIVDRFIEEGIPVKGLIGLGGVAKKSPYIMQVMADVMDMPIRIHKSDQTCALGAAMFAATVAGVYPRVEDAMEKMGHGFSDEYFPIAENVSIYKERYNRYKALGSFTETV